MYSWRIDALAERWKLACPNCGEKFPKNDFESYYLSGLDRHGIFDPDLADKTLLYNSEHPDEDDPHHHFGVDDGEGYAEGDRRWRFIGYYLIRGQWKQLVLGGLSALAQAFLLTGQRVYAHKAGVLLDRVADLYPLFDYKTQALVYERRLGSEGYVSVWHDACEETRLLAFVYDAVFEGIRSDSQLVEFLSRQAEEHRLQNPKTSFENIQTNIESGILLDPLRNLQKIRSNFPRTPFTQAVLMSVIC